MVVKNKPLLSKPVAKSTISSQVNPTLSHYHYFVGIDVSKGKLNIALLMQGRIVRSDEVTNTPAGHRKMGRLLKKIPNYQSDKVLVCMESTSIYHLPIANYLSSQKIAKVWVENAAQISRSMGIRRGQNDKADAKNIAEYAYRHQDKLSANYKLYQPPSPTFTKLKSTQRHRDKLLKMRLQLSNEVKEYKAMKTPEMLEIACFKEEINKKILTEINAAILVCEQRLEALIHEDEALQKTFNLIKTVEGVGLQVGVYLIVVTTNFNTITDAKKLACHIGIAPFKKLSGTSISVNKGVSHFADKIGKKMITNATGCAIRRYGGLRSYYERKVSEGKKEGVVLNACKNKLLHRIFAVVKSGKPYDKFHQWQPATQAKA